VNGKPGSSKNKFWEIAEFNCTENATDNVFRSYGRESGKKWKAESTFRTVLSKVRCFEVLNHCFPIGVQMIFTI